MSSNVNWYGDRVLSAAEKSVENGLTRLANEIAQDARRSMRTTKSGVDYRVGSGDPRADWMPEEWRERFKTRSSAPYEAPAAQTGGAGLQGSIQVEQDAPLSRKVGTNLSYGLYLEVGTSKMDERPYLRPALYKHTGRTGEEIFEALMP